MGPLCSCLFLFPSAAALGRDEVSWNGLSNIQVWVGCRWEPRQLARTQYLACELSSYIPWGVVKGPKSSILIEIKRYCGLSLCLGRFIPSKMYLPSPTYHSFVKRGPYVVILSYHSCRKRAKCVHVSMFNRFRPTQKFRRKAAFDRLGVVHYR